jgi:transcriptional regulator NrdR family protein
MNCPVCGEKTRVLDSRPDEDSVRRRRKCNGVECGYVFVTIEMDEDMVRKMEDNHDKTGTHKRYEF